MLPSSRKRTCTVELAQSHHFLCLKPGLLSWGPKRLCPLPKNVFVRLPRRRREKLNRMPVNDGRVK